LLSETSQLFLRNMCMVADPIAPVVVELAIAFGDCDRPPMGR